MRLTISDINNRKPQNSRLTAIDFDGHIIYSGNKYRAAWAKCTCGKMVRTVASSIANGRTKSCGCLDYDNKKNNHRKYKICTTGEYKKLYHVFTSMMSRCYNNKNISYKNYGGRGVKVCDEWKNNYDEFADWALNNGWRDGLQLDKDILGDGTIYSPSTCCFVTHIENNMNKKNGNFKLYDFEGAKLTLGQISKKTNVSYTLLYSRICERGMTLHDAILMGDTRFKPHAWKNKTKLNNT